ncbi:hypothetical protein H9P43_003021 [Blastocladiella emersonii ATCC 22665]|nr:hypothetical protein H9P43_003021 [Blastocladiella emersonii ATCC 22665]
MLADPWASLLDDSDRYPFALPPSPSTSAWLADDVDRLSAVSSDLASSSILPAAATSLELTDMLMLDAEPAPDVGAEVPTFGLSAADASSMGTAAASAPALLGYHPQPHHFHQQPQYQHHPLVHFHAGVGAGFDAFGNGIVGPGDLNQQQSLKHHLHCLDRQAYHGFTNNHHHASSPASDLPFLFPSSDHNSLVSASDDMCPGGTHPHHHVQLPSPPAIPVAADQDLSLLWAMGNICLAHGPQPAFLAPSSAPTPTAPLMDGCSGGGATRDVSSHFGLAPTSSSSPSAAAAFEYPSPVPTPDLPVLAVSPSVIMHRRSHSLPNLDASLCTAASDSASSAAVGASHASPHIAAMGRRGGLAAADEHESLLVSSRVFGYPSSAAPPAAPTGGLHPQPARKRPRSQSETLPGQQPASASAARRTAASSALAPLEMPVRLPSSPLAATSASTTGFCAAMFPSPLSSPDSPIPAGASAAPFGAAVFDAFPSIAAAGAAPGEDGGFIDASVVDRLCLDIATSSAAEADDDASLKRKRSASFYDPADLAAAAAGPETQLQQPQDLTPPTSPVPTAAAKPVAAKPAAKSASRRTTTSRAAKAKLGSVAAALAAIVNGPADSPPAPVPAPAATVTAPTKPKPKRAAAASAIAAVSVAASESSSSDDADADADLHHDPTACYGDDLLDADGEPRPFTCAFAGCTARFSRNHDLKRHERIHTGEKKWKCGECHRAFGRRDALARHMSAPGGRCKAMAGKRRLNQIRRLSGASNADDDEVLAAIAVATAAAASANL